MLVILREGQKENGHGLGMSVYKGQEGGHVLGRRNVWYWVMVCIFEMVCVCGMVC